MRKKEIQYHIIGWIVYLLYILIGEVFEARRFHLSLFTWSFTFIKLIEFYICYLWIYPRFLNKGKIPQLIGSILLAMIGFIIVRYFVEEVAFLHLLGKHNYGDGTTLSFYILDNVYFSTSALVLSAVVYLGFDSFYKERENRSLREEKIQAELAFLKSQINPHFLYNTLNYIYSLAYPVSEELANAIMKLSGLMRYMLSDSADGTVDLQKEVDYIENYISIYQLRFEDAFFVDFDAVGDIAGRRVASMILVPFVENAFKHGVVNDPAQPIEVDLKVTGKQLLFTVSNQVNKQQKDSTTGIGLPNIRRRLDLIYPERHELVISQNEDGYAVKLSISL